MGQSRRRELDMMSTAAATRILPFYPAQIRDVIVAAKSVQFIADETGKGQPTSPRKSNECSMKRYRHLVTNLAQGHNLKAILLLACSPQPTLNLLMLSFKEETMGFDVSKPRFPWLQGGRSNQCADLRLAFNLDLNYRPPDAIEALFCVIMS